MAMRARTFRDAKIKARSNPELVWWVFMRLSGVLLVFLALFHLFENYIIVSEATANYQYVATQYSMVSQRLYELALLSLGLLHGGNGLRHVIDDATAKKTVARFWIKLVIYTLITVIFVFGALALFSKPPIPGSGTINH